MISVAWLTVSNVLICTNDVNSLRHTALNNVVHNPKLGDFTKQYVRYLE